MESYVLTDEIRKAPALIRRRQKLIKNRPATRTRFTDCCLSTANERCEAIKYGGAKVPAETLAPTPLDALLESYLAVIETLIDEIESLEEAIEEHAGSPSKTQLRMTIPGVSYYSALAIYAELGEIKQFIRDKEVVNYAGLNPVIREFPDSRFEGGISKKGSGWLR